MLSTAIYEEIQSTLISFKGEFQPTYLYIKEHQLTKLKYFRKTTSDYPYSYLGSGKYWKQHIRKHGKENVKTLWCQLFTCIEDLVHYAILFSHENNIKESSA